MTHPSRNDEGGTAIATDADSCETRPSSGRRVVPVAYFLLFLGAGIWLPYFPLYLSDLGFSGLEIGIVVGLQPGLRWTSAIVWAYVADRFRIRHRLLVTAAILGTIAVAPLPFARGFPAVAGVTAALALLHAPLIPMVDATVIDHLDELGGDYGRLRLWGSVGFVFASLASALLIPLLSPASVPFLLLAATAALAPALARLPATQLGHPSGFRAPWRLVDRRLASFLATGFLLQLSSGAWGGFFSVYTAALGLPEDVPGIAWALAVTAEVLVLYSGTRVLSRVSPPNLILIVLVITAARWLLTAYARSELLVVVLQLGHGLAFAGFHLAAQMLLARLVPRESSTNGQALYGLVCYGLGGSLGLALAGALIDRVGPSDVFLYEAGIAVLALPPALWLRRLVGRRPSET